MDEQQIQEEQQNEVEALKSMYGDQMKIIKSAPPKEFSVALKSSEPEDPENGMQLGVTLRVKFPKTYPMESPEILIRHKTGLVNKDIDELEQRFIETCQANLGSVFIFTLVSETSEWLEEKKIEKEEEERTLQEEKEKSGEQKALEQEQFQKEKILQSEKNDIILETMNRFTRDIEVFGERGGTTPVTKETFKIWKNAFEDALKSLQKKDSLFQIRDRFERFPGTLSGRDIWHTKTAAALGLEEEEGLKEGEKISDPSIAGAIDEDLFNFLD